MSTFTGWNGDGCGCGSGGAKVDIAKLINAYEEMIHGLTNKLDEDKARATYRTIADSLSRNEIANALALKASDSFAQLLASKIASLEEKGLVTKAQGDTYWAALVDGGYVKNSDISKYVLKQYADQTYQTKAEMINYQPKSDMANYQKKAEAEITFAKATDVARTYARKEDVPSMEQFKTVGDSIESDGNNAKLKGNKILDRSGNALVSSTKVPVTEGSTVDVVQLGDNNTKVAFAQRPVIMYPDGTGKFTLKHLVTSDELGSVPVGGIIEWSKNWEDCPTGFDIMEWLHLSEFNGEWMPCSGAVLPNEPEYDKCREVLGTNTLPKRSFRIIRVKAVSAISNVPADVWAMDTTVLAETLRNKILEAQELINKYNNMVAGQNTQIANKAETSYVERTFETKLDAAKHETIQHARDTYATRHALTQEQVRATMMEDRVSRKVDTVLESIDNQIDSKATWSALEGERAERRSMDDSLQQQLIAEHIGCHEEDERLQDNIDHIDAKINSEIAERKKQISTLGKNVSDTQNYIAIEAQQRACGDINLDKKINETAEYLQDEIDRS